LSIWLLLAVALAVVGRLAVVVLAVIAQQQV
jgi:hypothetical protein